MFHVLVVKGGKEGGSCKGMSLFLILASCLGAWLQMDSGEYCSACDKITEL